MPEEYNMVVTALEMLSSEQLILGFVKTRLFDEEAKRGASANKGCPKINARFEFAAICAVKCWQPKKKQFNS